ncbi:hypothetical protein [Plantactinospora endophytica]|uniref:DUF4384 domain-containing protein n=1 Tax=Plantactinospora endophytica TaxID=673535 RepID=A0ABQ4DT13_9ACTN|nr:hypothetical protein [Plantactinospora endophytica]GIG85603.1 hypothetical protein Pen02_05390 [Plantactinospora endophytica]
MSATPMLVQTRPFAIEPLTSTMLPDGIFDNALYKLRIACHYTNTSGGDLTNVTLYLESVGDPGIVVTGQTYTFGRIPAGASVLVSWAADFQLASPGKPLVSFVARADGYSSARSIRQIFVSQTRYDQNTDTYSVTIPEGRLELSKPTVIPPAKGGWWPGDKPGDDKERPPWTGPYVPTGATMVWVPNPAYPGTHGELPFDDPWWKILGWIVFAIASLVGIIAAAIGGGTFNVGVKGKFEETDPGLGVECCKPAPGDGLKGGVTVAGVAGVIASGALVVGLADDADPHWRGQEATPPAPGELTTAERVDARWKLLDEPHAGRAYRTDVEWSYQRITTGATYQHGVSERQTNVHVTEEVKVVTPDTVTSPDLLWVRSTFTRPGGILYKGPELYAFALFRAPQGLYFLVPLTDDGVGFDARPGDGEYTAGLPLRNALPELEKAKQTPYGIWRVFVFAQDVNLVPPGTPAEIAAQTVGGFMVASAIQITFDPNQPCPLEAQSSIKVV